MNSVVLGWDPDHGIRWVPPFERVLAAARREGATTTRCPVDAEDVPSVGTTVHLMLQGRARGLIGHGTVRSASFRAVDPARIGTMATYVLVEWHHLLGADERIRTEELSARIPDVDWDSLYAASRRLTADQSAQLDRVWRSPHPSAGPSQARFRPLDAAEPSRPEPDRDVEVGPGAARG